MAKELTQAIVEEWIKENKGKSFSPMDIDTELGIDSRRGKLHRGVILGRLRDKGFIERCNRGTYRLILEDAPIIEWEAADISNFLSLKFPFELEKYVKLYPKSIAVIAGSPNVGKTAYLLNFVALNCEQTRVIYFTNEMGAEDIKERLSNLPQSIAGKFEARDRSVNYADVIVPDAINVIDFLELTDKFYLIAEELMKIYDKLTTGMAFIAIQKLPKRDWGVGGLFSASKPKLYLAMDSGILKIVKAKSRRDPRINPNDMTFKYNLVGGINFTNIQRTQGAFDV